MNEIQFYSIVAYLKAKKVTFAIKTTFEDNEPKNRSLVGIKITKEGKFYKANNKIIASNIAKYFI